MKRSAFILSSLVLIIRVAFAQCTPDATISPSGQVNICAGNSVALTATPGNVWTKMTDLGGLERQNAVGFSVGTKGYIGTGRNASTTAYSDLWEYNPANDTWTQKADFGGGQRWGAVGFGIGNKGYVGTGRLGAASFTDFWEYSPVSNTWTARAAFTGNARFLAVGFSIGAKGYIGTGWDGTSRFTDFREYDPATNAWTNRAAFTGASRHSAVGFSVGTNGYIGTGSVSFVLNETDFYEYNPATNTWAAKADFPAAGRYGATGFGIGTKGFLGTGFDGTSYYNDFYEYNPISNTWTVRAGYGAPACRYAVGFSIDDKGYIGTGLNGTTLYKQFWEYYPACTYSWSSGQTTQSITASTAGSYTVTVTAVTGCSATSEPTTVFIHSETPVINPSGTINICQGADTVLTAQVSNNSWTEKTNFGGLAGVARYNAIGFSIGTKGYIGTGFASGIRYKDFWEYNPSNNTWSQKANVGDTVRSGAVGFSIGSKGYIGTGWDGGTPFSDFWEYDPSNNTWSSKPNFPGGSRYLAVGFSIGSKGYIGTGNNGSSFTNDFWEYNPATNLWTQKANVGGGGRDGAVGFGTGSKGYIGTGNSRKDFWEYDPVTDGWTSKTAFAGIGRSEAVGFSIGTIGYIGTGLTASGLCNDFWEYDPLANSWIQKANFGGTARSGAVGFSIGSKGYIGTGDDGVRRKDFWEFSPVYTYSWSSGQTTQSITASTAGSYTVTVTDGYGCSATSAATTIIVNPLPVATITPSGPTTFCSGSNVSLTAATGSYYWKPKADFGGSARFGAVGFSIGSKGYIGTGSDGANKKDFWEYDPAANTWSQKADFGGTARQAAVGFSIGSKGYIGTGNDGANKKDFWEYDPASNTWTQKTDFGGIARQAAVGFAIGSKGYIGTGNGAGLRKDFWEYDPAINAWTAKADFGGTARHYAVGFSLGSKGYIGTGSDGSLRKDFWEYDPAANSWLQRSDFGGTARLTPIGFGLNSKGFVVTGNDGTRRKDFWEFDPVANSWLQLADFPGSGRTYGTGFTIGNRAYIGTGGGVTNFNDFWEYNADYTYSWSTGETTQSITASTAGSYTVTVTDVYGCSATSAATTVIVNPLPVATITPSGPTTFCSGGSVTLTSSAGTSYQWSSGQTTQAITVNTAGSYSVTVFNAAGCSATSAATVVTVNANPATPTITPSGPTTFCSGGSVTLTSSAGTSYQWSSGQTTQAITVNVAGSYTVIVFNAAGCSATSAATVVTVNANPATPTITPSGPTTFCSGGSVTLTSSAGTSYQWSSGQTTQAITVNVAGSYTVIVFNAAGCSATSAPTAVLVNPLPVATITAGGPTTFCQGGSVTLTAQETPGGNVWTQKADFGGTARFRAAGFSIGNIGYLGMGGDGSFRNDVWEYDPAANTWNATASFSLTVRSSPVAFSIGNKGYLGTGFNGTNLKDFWEYNPATFTWTQRADFGGTARSGAIGFAIGAKGYIGTGNDGANKKDFWEYDPGSNTWTQKTDFSGTARSGAIGFAIGTKGYIGTGNDGVNKKDFWEYDPLANTWIQKADFGGSARSGAVAFNIGLKGYIGTGNNLDFWEYNPVTNIWIQKANVGGSSRNLAAGFSIGVKGYIGSGVQGISLFRDFWEYSQGLDYAWSTGETTQSITASMAGSYTVTVTDANGCSATSSPTTVTITSTNTWAGGGTSNWNTGSNWSCGIVPNHPQIDAVILNGASPMPVMTADVLVRSLALNGSATVDINGNTLTVNQNITGTGNLKGSATSNLVLKGAAGTVSFAPGFNTLKDLLLTDTASATLGNALNIVAGASPGSVTVNTNAVLNTGGNLTLKSDVNGTARVGILTGSITGDVTVERYIHTGTTGGAHTKTWQFLSTPTTGQTIRQAWQENGTTPAGFGTIITGTGTGFDITTALPSLKFFNDVSVNWTAVTNTNTALQNKLGYMLFVRGDRTVATSGASPNNTTLRSKGTLFQPSEPPPSVAVAANKFQAFGNPYASRIEFSKVRAISTGINDVFYVWDPKLAGNYNVGGYQTITGLAGYIPTVGTPPAGNPATVYYPAGVPAPFIESGQAVFVKGNGTGGNVNFNETVKASGSRLVNRPGNGSFELANRGFIFASLFTDTYNIADGNIVAFEEGLGNELNTFDAPKIMNGGENFGIRRSDSLLAVEARDHIMKNDTIFYHLQNLKKQPYQFRFAPVNMRREGIHAYLIDHFSSNSTEVSLTDSSFISFSITDDVRSQAADRFILVFAKTKKGPVKSNTPKEASEQARGLNKGITETKPTGSAIAVYPNPVVDQQINIRFSNMAKGNYRIELISKPGQVVYKGEQYIDQDNTTHTFRTNNVLAPGNYQLRITANSREHNMEIIVMP